MTSAGSIAIIVARVLWGGLFFVGLHPAIVHITSIILDGGRAESDAIGSLGNYQKIDKIIDLIYELILGGFLIYIFRYLWYARYVLPFIVFRWFGVITFLVTGDIFWLAIFPDVPSTLFLVFTILDIVQLDHFIRTRWRIIIVIILIIIFQVVKEINHHVNIKFKFSNSIWVFVWAGLFFLFIAYYKRANLCYKKLDIWHFPSHCIDPPSKNPPSTILFLPALWRSRDQEENKVNKLWTEPTETTAGYSKLIKLKTKTFKKV